MHGPEQIPQRFHAGPELLGASKLSAWLPLSQEWGATRSPGYTARSFRDAVDVYLVKVDDLVYRSTALRGAGWYETAAFSRPQDEPTALTTKAHGRRSSKPPRWMKRVVDRLEHLVNLPVGWNGYGAPSIAPDAAAAALNVVVALDRGDDLLPSIVPTQDGGVQLEWHRGDIDLELEIDASGSVDLWYMDESTGKEREESLPLSDAIPEIDALLTIVDVRN